MSKILNYENQIKTDESELIYTIMYRRWDVINQLIGIKSNWEKLKIKEYLGITVEKCFKKNLQYLKSNKNKLYYDELCKKLGKDFENLESEKNCAYDTKDFYDNKSVFDIFFKGNQPILDVKYFEIQTLATKQLMKNNATIVLDEVGTGKTVAGIYAIQKVIQERINKPSEVFTSAAILIISPYKKREDWASDIRRQLGRNSIIVGKSDNGKIIKQKACNPHKPLIYIMGCCNGTTDNSKSELKYSLKTFLSNKNREWDLVIIDECHNCFENYKGIRSDRIMLLTATPIVVNSKGTRNFDEYKSLMNSILGGEYWNNKIEACKKINPINNRKTNEEDIFVCNYKEDIFDVEINRQIKFIECERHKKRQEWFNKLRYERCFFAAIFADQDDLRLAEKMKENFPDCLEDYTILENLKLKKMKETINSNEYKLKSIIIFCELIATVDMIYDELSSLSNEKVMVGKKHSGIGEIKNITNNPNIILEKLKSNIHSGNRSILITTGKSGGIGLNLGEFHTIIHYELPFTSNDLEQRFGRIERADDLILQLNKNSIKQKKIENEMIFLVNTKADDESDFETNRMLYYAVNKINIACKYMPLRNTVLFHTNFIERIKNDVDNYVRKISSLKFEFDNYISYKAEEKEIKKIISIIISELPEKDKEKINSKLNTKDKINEILNNITSNKKIEVSKEQLIKFEKQENYNKVDIIINDIIEYVLWFEKTCNLLGVKFSITNTLDDDMFDKTHVIENSTELERNDSYNIIKNDSDKIMNNVKKIKEKIISREIIMDDICKRIVDSATHLSDQSASGVFYSVYNDFKNESVENFRKGNIKNE